MKSIALSVDYTIDQWLFDENKFYMLSYVMFNNFDEKTFYEKVTKFIDTLETKHLAFDSKNAIARHPDYVKYMRERRNL